MDTVADTIRTITIVWIGLLTPLLIMIGARRRHPGIFGAMIFMVTGAIVSAEEYGEPYSWMQIPLRLAGCVLLTWWVWCERDDPAIAWFNVIDRK